jgi:hypothetical protein
VFDVVLDRAPLANVVLNLSLSNGAVAALDQSTLTFTPENWNVRQRVALRPVDNQVVNPDVMVDVTVSVDAALSDDDYDALAPQVFSALVRDDDYRPPLAGDYNGDSSVDAADYIIWRRTLGNRVEPYSGGDGSGNGVVSDYDHVVWRAGFGSSAAAGGAGSAMSLARTQASASQDSLPPFGAGMSSSFHDDSLENVGLVEENLVDNSTEQFELLLALLAAEYRSAVRADDARAADEFGAATSSEPEAVDSAFQSVWDWRREN